MRAMTRILPRSLGAGRLWPLAAVCLGVALSARLATADPVGEAARRIGEQHRDAVITIRLVLKEKVTMMGMDGDEEESRSEVLGTIIAPSGLTVVSLTSLNPSSMYAAMYGDYFGSEDDSDFKVDSQISSATLLLTDGVELPGRVVLRDEDQDLAFIRPTEKLAKDLPFIDLADHAEAAVMDELVALGRLGNLGRRAPSITVGRIEAVIQKPRLFYSVPALSELGCPVFTLEGKVVGVHVLRKNKMEALSEKDRFMGIIVPAADVLDAAQQAE